MNISDINKLSPEKVEALLGSITSGEKNPLELEHTLASGIKRNVRVLASYIMVNRQPTIFSIIEDVTDSTEAMNKVKYLANYDSLTGLPKRNLLEDRLKKALEQAERKKTHVVLMFLDLDNFKNVNDTL